MPHADAPLTSTRPSSIRTLWSLAAAALLSTAGLFAIARDQGWTLGWVTLGVLGLAFLANLVCVQLWNPTLIRQRVGIRRGTKTWDLVWTGFFLALSLSVIVVAVWELRASGPHSPGLPWLAGMALFLPAWGFVISSMVENPFFEKGVRIQTERGHRVIDTGPYTLVRHPGYVGFILWLLSTPLLLDARWTWIPVLLTIAALVVRTALEDLTLHQELPGYRDYAARTRYRLVPGLW